MHASPNLQASPDLQDCNCLAIRQAARHVSQFYDQLFAPVGLRATQFAILYRLRRDGPMTINALASELVMDRTTLGRNIQPLDRDAQTRVLNERVGDAAFPDRAAGGALGGAEPAGRGKQGYD